MIKNIHMKNLLNLIVLLTCVTFACESKAVDINEIRGKFLCIAVTAGNSIISSPP